MKIQPFLPQKAALYDLCEMPYITAKTNLSMLK